jgi:hypothetical protein
VIADLLSGQYKNPVRIVAFNTVEKWSQDISEDVAHGCATAAASRCEIFRSACESSLICMTVAITTSSYRSRCAWSKPRLFYCAPMKTCWLAVGPKPIALFCSDRH